MKTKHFPQKRRRSRSPSPSPQEYLPTLDQIFGLLSSMPEGTSVDWDHVLTENKEAMIRPGVRVWRSILPAGTNILHEIAQQRFEFQTFGPFVEWLLGKAQISNVLLQQASWGYCCRPLHQAMRYKNHEFFEMILKHFENRTSSGEDDLTLDILLRPNSQDESQFNCIDFSIEARSPYTIAIIEKCKHFRQIFMEDDLRKGIGTPLHHAVVCGIRDERESPHKSGFDALEVVIHLIRVCPDALYEVNRDGQTPYRSGIQVLKSRLTRDAIERKVLAIQVEYHQPSSKAAKWKSQPQYREMLICNYLRKKASWSSKEIVSIHYRECLRRRGWK